MPKILIVDDNPQKASQIEAYLCARGIPQMEINFAGSVNEAKGFLKANHYNIVFVDLVLPLRAGQEASNSLGIRLVEEVCSRSRYFEPDIIVAISAYSDAASEFEGKFSKYTAKVINYDETNLSWQSDIDEVLSEYSRRLEKGMLRTEFDISFICALEDEEQQLNRVLDCPDEYFISNSGLRYKKGIIVIDDVEVNFTVTKIGVAGPVASASHSSRVIIDFHPKLIVMTGICAGIASDAALGDIVVALSTWDWQTGKFVTKDDAPVLLIEPNMVQCSDAVESTITDFIQRGYDGDAIRRNWPADKPRAAPLVFDGPVASGSSVVASQEVIKNIKDNQHRKVIGLEMESYGLYYSCRHSAHRPLDYIMIKGVSDRADEAKNDNLRHYAAYASAKFALQYIHYAWKNLANI